MDYTRHLAAGYTSEQLAATFVHVRDHLAAIADPHDDPSAFADAVRVRTESRPDGGCLISGTLDAEPRAAYLDPGFDPDEAERRGQ